jgi:hypothetical protein
MLYRDQFGSLCLRAFQPERNAIGESTDEPSGAFDLLSVTPFEMF